MQVLAGDWPDRPRNQYADINGSKMQAHFKFHYTQYESALSFTLSFEIGEGYGSVFSGPLNFVLIIHIQEYNTTRTATAVTLVPLNSSC